MTQSEALAKALEYVVSHALPVRSEPEMIKLMEAAPMNEFLERTMFLHDYWVVHFKKELPPGVACVMPSTVMIVVEEASGKVYERDFSYGLPG